MKTPSPADSHELHFFVLFLYVFNIVIYTVIRFLRKVIIYSESSWNALSPCIFSSWLELICCEIFRILSMVVLTTNWRSSFTGTLGNDVYWLLHISRMSLLHNTTHAYIGETGNGWQSSVAVIWDNNRDRIRRVEERKVRGRLMQGQPIVISISAQWWRVFIVFKIFFSK